MRRLKRGGDLFEALDSSASSRVLALSVRSWPFISRGVSSSSPAVVVSDRRVVAATPPAMRLGISIGDKAQAALQRSSELEIIAADFEAELRSFERVVGVIEDFCPEVEVFAPGSCGFDMKGPTKYFGGEHLLLEKLSEALCALEFESHVEMEKWTVDQPRGPFASRTCLDLLPNGNGLNPLVGTWYCIGVADGIFAAKIASGYGVAVKPGFTREFLRGFPVEIFGEGDDVKTLKGSGIEKVADLISLPRSLVVERFGSFGQRIFDLGSGSDPDKINKRDLPETARLRVELDPPAYLAESVIFSMRKGAADLFGDLDAKGLYPLRMRVVFETETAESISRIWSSNVPISLQFLLSWSRWQIDAWTHPVSNSGREPPRSGVIYCDIEVLEVSSNPATQLDFDSVVVHPQERVLRSIERARAKLGKGSVTVARSSSGRSPREQFTVFDWQLELFDEPKTRSNSREVVPPWPGKLPDPAPSIVFDPMIPVEVRGRNGNEVVVAASGELSCTPELIIGAKVFAFPQRIVKVLGPWPMTERWWDPSRSRRLARIQVLSDQGVAMIVVIESSKWFLEAIYD